MEERSGEAGNQNTIRVESQSGRCYTREPEVSVGKTAGNRRHSRSVCRTACNGKSKKPENSRQSRRHFRQQHAWEKIYSENG